MNDDSDSSPGRSNAAERPLIDAAWAQFETITARQKATRAELRQPLVVPGYRVLGEIYRGGQGVVYMAVQDSTRRKVAVKVLKEGPFADEAELARFNREVDVLTRLDHPHIVSIRDRGLTAEGRAYYVMDYIPGRPLDAHVAGEALSTREALELFRKICEAVNAAHLRGIIHRDLKPSNIRIDEGGVPRVLDFGLAKLAPDGGSSAATMTATGQFVGSLPWASPEQAEGRSELLDVRTDVYSLGVILYHLLTGSFPYPVSGRMNEVIRNIVSVSPAKPSTHARGIDHDVEVIVLKCLEKDPDRRYQSAGELARDVQRYLNGEPIEARPASSLYQFRQFARRNKGMIAAAVAVFATLALGTLVSTLGFLRATSAESLALQHAEESSRAAAKAAAVTEFLQQMLSSVDPSKALGREVTVRQALDDAAAKIDSGSLKDQPSVEADLRYTIGATYLSLGHYADAERHLQSALAIHRSLLGDTATVVAFDLNHLANAAGDQGKYAEQETYRRECLAILKRLYQGDHPEVAGAEQGLGAALRVQGKLAEAERHYRASLEMRRRLLGPEHDDVAQSLNSLALLQQNKGNLTEAENLFREALAMRRKLLSDPHPLVADGLNNLANVLHWQARHDDAEPLLREALEMRRKLFSTDHPAVAQAAYNLANVLWDKKDRAPAEPLYREALAIWRRTLPADHLNITSALDSLSAAVLPNNPSEAESLSRESLAIREARPPTNDRYRLVCMAILGEALLRQGKFEEAETLLLKAQEGLKARPEEAPKRETFLRLIHLYELWNRPEDAEKWRAELAQLPPADS